MDPVAPSSIDASPADASSTPTPAALASALAPAAQAGHFDELRGVASPIEAATASGPATDAPPAAPARTLRDASAAPATVPATAAIPEDAPSTTDRTPLAPAWSGFFDRLGRDGFADLHRRARHLERQIRDNGVTYNVYADVGGPQRPWSLDLFPLIVSSDSWAAIERGVLQRVRMLDRMLADVYGPRNLLAEGLLPAALVRGHPGYVRAMVGATPPGDTWLHIAAFDLARGPDGRWWVVSQRTEAPSGLGYLLENRLAVARQFPHAFDDLKVQRLAATYSALLQSLQRMSPAGEAAHEPPHVALLTPGPYNETYFEQAYLARYLGLTLVEGNDLTVRGDRLYLKTLQGLRPVHGLIKRLDDDWLDPLEQRADSTLGVPGLMQAIRAGNLLVANMPGSAFLESPALLGFLPAVARRLIGEELSLPALPTWWCGERAAMEAVLPRLADSAIKPTYPPGRTRQSFDAVLGSQLDQRERDEWAGRILRAGEEHTVQSYLPLSQMPTWQRDATPGRNAGHIEPRAVMLRVFAISDGPQSWRVLPGGLARLAGANAQIASMQRGGSSADVWVQTRGAVDQTSLLPEHNEQATHAAPLTLERYRAPVTSRAAENMFWLGRYTERADNAVRLVRLTLDLLGGEDTGTRPVLAWLHRLAVANALVPRETPGGPRSRRVFERALIAELGNIDEGGSVGYNLRCVRNAAATVRERLSPDHWKLIVHGEAGFSKRCVELAADTTWPAADALRMLEIASANLSAITGAQTDRMTRDDAWRLLSIGRHIERLGFLSDALAAGFDTDAVHETTGFDAMVALFDSTITFHARYQQRRDVATLIDLLVLDTDNPRALAWVTRQLRGRIARLAGEAPGQLTALSYELPDPAGWSLGGLCRGGDVANQKDHLRYPQLDALFGFCESAARRVSDALGAQYFTLTQEARRSVGA